MNQGTLDCVDKNGCTNVFYYRYSVSGFTDVKHSMIIFKSCDYSDSEFFELVAKEVDDTTLKIISITKNSDALYGAKGIPDAAIPEMIALTGKGIISSSMKHPEEPNEYRTPAATKVWDRLVDKGNAVYDDKTDRYKYT